MTYNSKRTIAAMATGVILSAGYIGYALSSYAPAPGDLRAWAIAMLIFIGFGVGGAILVQIALHIALAMRLTYKQGQEQVQRILSSQMIEDEWIKLVTLKATYVAYACVGIGFLAALCALALGTMAVIALNMLLGALLLASLLYGGVSVYLYERGMGNG